MSSPPFRDVRVVDLTQILSGPFATQILADLGAEVIKVEAPEGDKARGNGPFVEGRSTYFASLNRGKKSVCLDLKTDAGRDLFLSLVETSDAVVENFRPGVMARLGLGFERLKAMNPRLIYAACSGFGQEGPRAAQPALDAVIQAMAGTMALTGDEEPARVGFSAGDIGAGLYLAFAIAASLFRRERTGEGGFLDISMLETQVALLENAFARHFATGEEPRRMGTRHPVMAPFQAFHTADRPIVVAVSSQAHWLGFCSALGHSEWLQDSRFVDGNARRLHLEALEAAIAPVLRQATADVWLARLSEAQVPSGPLRTVGEVAADPDLNDRGIFCEVDFDGVPVRVVGSPLRIDGLRRTARRVPALDADGEEVRAGCAASGERGGEVR